MLPLAVYLALPPPSEYSWSLFSRNPSLSIFVLKRGMAVSSGFIASPPEYVNSGANTGAGWGRLCFQIVAREHYTPSPPPHCGLYWETSRPLPTAVISSIRPTSPGYRYYGTVVLAGMPVV